ncbi:MAG TPA: ADP-ribosyltransferase domain-containing protein [Vampirovibrionales bacterium]
MINFEKVGAEFAREVDSLPKPAFFDFAVISTKQCKKGIPCGNSCIAKTKSCKGKASPVASAAVSWIQKTVPKSASTPSLAPIPAVVVAPDAIPVAKKERKKASITKNKAAIPAPSQTPTTSSSPNSSLTAPIKTIAGGPMDQYSFEEDVKKQIYKKHGKGSERLTKAFMKEHGAPPPPESQIAALFTYSGARYKVMNSILRHGKYDYDGDEFNTLMQVTKDLDVTKEIRMATKALANAPASARYEGEVYRGTRLPKSLIKSYKEGGIVTEAGFVSTSKKPSIADVFSYPGADDEDAMVTYKIKSKTGVSLGKLAVVDVEEEVLFTPGTRFKIGKISGSPQKGYQIELEELEDRSETQKIISEMDDGVYKPPYPADFAEEEEGEETLKISISDIQRKMAFPIGLPDK